VGGWVGGFGGVERGAKYVLSYAAVPSFLVVCLRVVVTTTTTTITTTQTKQNSSAFLLSWADPHVTLPVQALLTLAALVASLMLYLIPTRLLLLAVGSALYTGLRRRRQASLKAAAAAAAAGSMSPRRTPRTPKTPEEGGGEGEEESEGDWEGKVVDLDWRDWLANPQKRRMLLPSLMKHVVARTPDLPEVIHREIARRRVHPEEQQLGRGGGGGRSQKSD
jgi:hypothetical protein